MSSPFEQEFSDEFPRLTPEQQAEVMSFIRALKKSPVGTPGRDLLKFAGTFTADALAEMSAAIEQGCEQVDQDGW